MKFSYTVVAALAVFHVVFGDDDDDKMPKKLQIGVKKRVEGCTFKSRKGDTLHMQYRVSLQ